MATFKKMKKKNFVWSAVKLKKTGIDQFQDCYKTGAYAP